MIVRPLLLKAGAVAATIIGVLVLVQQCQDAYRHQGERHVQIIHDSVAVAKAETVYVHDRDAAVVRRVDFHNRVDPFRVSTNPAVRTVIAAGDAVVLADSVALADCDTLVAKQKRLIADLSTPEPEPWITASVDALYGVAGDTASNGQIVLRAGLTTRPVLPGGLSIQVAAERSQHSGLYVGLHKQF